jgi:hypothetical protein
VCGRWERRRGAGEKFVKSTQFLKEGFVQSDKKSLGWRAEILKQVLFFAKTKGGNDVSVCFFFKNGARLRRECFEKS